MRLEVYIASKRSILVQEKHKLMQSSKTNLNDTLEDFLMVLAVACSHMVNCWTQLAKRGLDWNSASLTGKSCFSALPKSAFV